ncbi:MAG: MBL fold metallo-hydrolase [Thermoproteaceae archaeon]|jgi:ribonuclease Z|nr:MBL fold metallo-hydrolase [Thermoproteaceae archaeon]
MEIYVLGYGGWLAPPHAGHVSILARTDASLLIDAGECTYAQLVRCGLQLPDVVFVSHRHGDHMLGLPTLVLAARKLGRAIKVVAGRGTLEAVRALLSAVGLEDALGRVVEVIEAAGPLMLGGTIVKFAPARHTVEATAVRVEFGGRCLVYSSDTAPAESVVELARGCDLLIYESSANAEQEAAAHALGHSTTLDAVEAAKAAGVRMLMPVHFHGDLPVVPPGVTVVVPTPCGRLAL